MPAINEAFRRKYCPTEGYVGRTREDDAPQRLSPYVLHSRESLRLHCREHSHSLKPARWAVYNRPTAKQWFVLHLTIPLGESPTEKAFNILCAQWKHDTLYSSSLEEICFHPAYQTIMAMGEKAVPFILRELAKQFGHWFYALSHIVQKDVAAGAKDLEDARQRWLDWGRETKLL